jgi:xanthine dehydrogenase small subunit
VSESDVIQFVLDGKLVELRNVDPTRTVLQFLREDLRRTGTKEGCAEGDCGACTVVVAERRNGETELRPVNACIHFLPMRHGKEIFTVESLGKTGGGLHPAQRAMIECHGSQCGFCTPGFVMSLFALYSTNPAPTRRQIDDALAGNLCRCTGYRSIVAAARAMYDFPRQHDLPNSGALDRIDAGNLALHYGERRFFAPVTIDELVSLRSAYPQATMLAGGTDVGLWVTKQHRLLDTVIYTGRVAELRKIGTSESHLEIGAAVPFAEAIPVIVAQYPHLEELFLRFASPPIRNVGTLGGNIANGSPIGDSMPALMVAGATLILRSPEGQRETLLENFYVDYMINDLRPGEFVECVRIPLPVPGVVVRSHKLSKRFDQDISAVCTAYRLERNGNLVKSFAMACGGMAPVVKRAVNCEATVTGNPWSQATIQKAKAALAKDFSPISDMRATADYRLRAAQNLLQRFYLETTGQLDQSVYSYGRQV